jgi:4-hydroxy-tetrahydrodipicolinate synthase
LEVVVEIMAQFPVGSIPTMITPFLEDNTIDWVTVDRLVEWYIASGCVGIFTVCLSSEMYELTPNERLQLAEHIKKKVNGRIFIAATGTFEGTAESQAEFCLQISKYCDAVVILTNQLAKKEESDEVWLENCKKIVELTGQIKLGLYEVPMPYKRVLTPEILRWAVQTGRFVFHKDTCRSTSLIKEKLKATTSITNSPFRFYNANMATLLQSCIDGADGFCGVSANFYPYFHSTMFRLFYSEDYKQNLKSQDTVRRIHNFLAVADAVVAESYPAGAKVYLSHYGPKDGHSITPVCRICPYKLPEDQHIRFKELFILQREMCKILGVTEVEF